MFNKIHDLKKEVYGKYLSESTPNEQLFSLIRTIRMEYIIAIVTTASKSNCIQLLEYFNVSNLFDKIISQEDVVNLKPHPEGYIKVMSEFSIEPKNTIIFEDSEIGIRAAKASNAEVFAIK